MAFLLSGFATDFDYQARVPNWEPVDEYSSLDLATAAAENWRTTAGPNSTVEILEDEDGVLQVVGLIDAGGFQRI